MSNTQRSRRVVAMATGAVALHTGEAASQLITDAEPTEVCEVLRLGDRLDVPEWLAFTRDPGLMVDATGGVCGILPVSQWLWPIVIITRFRARSTACCRWSAPVESGHVGCRS